MKQLGLPKHVLCRLRPTPDKALTALLPAVGLLWLSERYRWFAFNEHKNWTVLIAIAVVLGAIVLLLLWLGVSLLLRRRFQFGIRSLLVLTAAVAVVGSWFTVRMQQARMQKTVVELADQAYYGFQLDNARAVPVCLPVELHPDQPGPAWIRNLVGVEFLADLERVRYRHADDSKLARLRGLVNIKELELQGTQVTDAGLIYLEGLTNLQLLALDATEVTDDGLTHIRGLTSLQRLSLGDTQITNAGLEHLEGLTNITHLGLDYTNVSAAGLPHLRGLANLCWLDLFGTKITDTALMHLKGLTSLRWIDLLGTQVTPAGVRDLRRALPDCQICGPFE
jgi:hypothetical protein